MFTIWIKPIPQRIANDGVFNYGISEDTVMWQQPRRGGEMMLFFRDPSGCGLGFYRQEGGSK